MNTQNPECKRLRKNILACYDHWLSKLGSGYNGPANCENEVNDFRRCIQETRNRRRYSGDDNRYSSYRNRDDESWMDSAAETVRDVASRFRDQGREWGKSWTDDFSDRNRYDLDHVRDRAHESSNDFSQWKDDMKYRARRKADDYDNQKNEYKDRARHTANEWQDSARDTKERAKRKAYETRDRISESADDASHKANQTADDWATKVKEKAGDIKDKIVENLPRELQGDVSQKSPNEIKESLQDRAKNGDNNKSWFK